LGGRLPLFGPVEMENDRLSLEASFTGFTQAIAPIAQATSAVGTCSHHSHEWIRSKVAKKRSPRGHTCSREAGSVHGLDPRPSSLMLERPDLVHGQLTHQAHDDAGTVEPNMGSLNVSRLAGKLDRLKLWRRLSYLDKPGAPK
jgi:hypothetical protein